MWSFKSIIVVKTAMQSEQSCCARANFDCNQGRNCPHRKPLNLATLQRPQTSFAPNGQFGPRV